MIVHYVESHQYQPPEEFVVAVLASPLPNTAEYRDAIQPLLPRPPIRKRISRPCWKKSTQT